MKKAAVLCLAAVLVAGCGGGGQPSFPYTPIPDVPQAVNDLGHLIGQEQRDVVTPGGTVYDPGYSSDDQQKFDSSGRLQQIVDSVKASSTFAKGVAAIQQLDSASQQTVYAAYETPDYQTWATNGQIGDGVTDAGFAVEQEIADALTQAVQSAVGGETGAVRLPADSIKPLPRP
jgi:hypothetical protein